MMKWRRFLCRVFGHSFLVVSRIDIERSQLGHLMCTRCGLEVPWQYDK